MLASQLSNQIEEAARRAVNGSPNGKESAKDGNQSWKVPAPLKTELKTVLPFNSDTLPYPVRDWLTDIANRMRCPIDYVAAAFLVMCASLIGTRLTIKPKQRDDWTVVANLWGAIIGDPSMMKTPALTEVFKTLNRLVAQQRADYEADLQRYEAEKVTYEARKAVFQSQEKDRLKGKLIPNPVEYPVQPQPPVERRFVVNDATVEKLGRLLNENPSGLLMLRDELMGLLASWDKQGREEDRSFYLEAWNGNGSKTIDRIGSGTLHVENICLSLLGTIQPSKLLGYLQAATGYENDGFVQRLQIAVFPDKPEWQYTDAYPDKSARDAAFEVIQKLVHTDLSAIGCPKEEYNRHPYTRFDDQAQQVFKEWLIDLETRILPNESGLLQEHFAKYRSLMPSIALVLHCINYIDGMSSPDEKTGMHLVSEWAAKTAVLWCDYLASHARRIYGLLDTSAMASAKELLRHIKDSDVKDGFKVREVVQKGWYLLKTTQEVEAALVILLEHHYVKELTPEPAANGRPQARQYLINPKIFPENT